MRFLFQVIRVPHAHATLSQITLTRVANPPDTKMSNRPTCASATRSCAMGQWWRHRSVTWSRRWSCSLASSSVSWCKPRLERCETMRIGSQTLNRLIATLAGRFC